MRGIKRKGHNEKMGEVAERPPIERSEKERGIRIIRQKISTGIKRKKRILVNLVEKFSLRGSEKKLIQI